MKWQNRRKDLQMCLKSILSKRTCKNKIKKLSFPLTLYKVFSKRINGDLFPAYDKIGKEDVENKTKFMIKKGVNKAIIEELTTVTCGQHSSGFSAFFKKEDADRLLFLFKSVDSTWGEKTERIVKKIKITKPEHILFLGKEKLVVSCDFVSQTSRKLADVAIVSQILV